MSEPKYYRKMLLRRLIYVRNQTVSYFDSMTGFGRDTPVTLHQNQRRLSRNARVSNRLKFDTVDVYFER